MTLTLTYTWDIDTTNGFAWFGVGFYDGGGFFGPNLILDVKNGFETLVLPGFNPDGSLLLKEIIGPAAGSDTVSWTFAVEGGRPYGYYTHVFADPTSTGSVANIASPIPEPAYHLVLGAGLVGVLLIRRRFRRWSEGSQVA
ncbi:MAG: hypothetical protein GY953_26030 [bacterium]|nr:hypothetical protein [bacterium]